MLERVESFGGRGYGLIRRRSSHNHLSLVSTYCNSLRARGVTLTDHQSLLQHPRLSSKLLQLHLRHGCPLERAGSERPQEEGGG